MFSGNCFWKGVVGYLKRSFIGGVVITKVQHLIWKQLWLLHFQLLYFIPGIKGQANEGERKYRPGMNIGLIGHGTIDCMLCLKRMIGVWEFQNRHWKFTIPNEWAIGQGNHFNFGPGWWSEWKYRINWICGLCTQIEMNTPGNGVYPLNPGHCFVKGDSDSVRFVHVLWRGNSMLR